jgi:hypothetical protein
MIDTVILSIPRDKIKKIDNNQGFYPEWTLKSRAKGYEIWIKNMPKIKGEDGPYYPRLTGYKRGSEKNNIIPMVNIEFSVAKLLYGNNLDEVEEKDFPIIIDTLHRRLSEMGELIIKMDLENAIISVFHPSKNIVISDGYTAYSVIKELSKINLTKKLELTKVNFKNDGNAIQMYAINHSIVYYDKIADLNQNQKKAVDQDQTPQQFSLFEEIKKKQPKLEILRMEIRLCKKPKINSIMQELGFQKNPTFKDVFKKDVCQKIVKWYWDTIIKDENLFLFELSNTPKQKYKDILRDNEKMKVKQAIYLVGLDVLCKDGGGIRELRDISEKRIKQRNWYCVSDGIKLLNKLADGKPLHSWVRQIEESITSFKPYHIESRAP